MGKKARPPGWFMHSSRYEFDSAEELADYDDAWAGFNAVLEEHGATDFHARLVARPTPEDLRGITRGLAETLGRINAEQTTPSTAVDDERVFGSAAAARVPAEDPPTAQPWWRRLFR